ncbi:hypothetical protein GCM10007907_17640 [Chitinimonas prasina]|uniref:Bacterial EndoU nuclease domain-containing protein n=1 Tax=Chitinimonas prasina TaxID=1434937 RepID=A0ABQ5YJ50_9NEIS|nr:hypothetical protein GCM10007907_17640 [Chitinimonas prasina]
MAVNGNGMLKPSTGAGQGGGAAAGDVLLLGLGPIDPSKIANKIGGTQSSGGIGFNNDIPKHFSTFDGFSQKSGISGTHNMNEFTQAASQNNVKVLSQIPGSASGLVQIQYQIPSIDRAGNAKFDSNGQPVYKNEVFLKTVYDPTLISDAKIIELGRQAAEKGYQAAINDKKQAYNSEAGGILFRIYIDPKTGIVTNYHPK